MSTAWTAHECEIAATIFRTTPGGGSYGHQRRALYLIAKALNRTVHAINGRFTKHGASFDGPDRRRKHRAQPEGTSHYHIVTPLPVSAAALADRDHRALLEPRSQTAAFFGDPLPGYSELDRRRAREA